ncbi:MAG: VOC family protein [Ilumatobacteraceae bacterium]
MSRLVRLTAHGERRPWENIGLSFPGGVARLADVELVVNGGAPDLSSWTIEADTDATVDIDGITTHLVSSSGLSAGESPIGPTVAVRLDHVVVNTDDGERTSAAFEAVLGLGLRRVRDAGRGVSQRFHMLENCVIEIVSGPHVTGPGASLWGMVLSVADIDALAAWLGPDVMSPPKNAVQPGRRIATVRAAAGLGVPFAVMTPHVPATD